MFIPLLEGLDITGKTITADALLTQRSLARYLLEERNAHYLFTTKDNQPTLPEDIRLFFQNRGKPDFRQPFELEHGRLESRAIWSTTALNLERAVGRLLGCVPRGVWQGTTRRNSFSIATSCNAVRRRTGRAPGGVAAFTLRVSMPMTGSYLKISVLRSFPSGQLLFLG